MNKHQYPRHMQDLGAPLPARTHSRHIKTRWSSDTLTPLICAEHAEHNKHPFFVHVMRPSSQRLLKRAEQCRTNSYRIDHRHAEQARQETRRADPWMQAARAAHPYALSHSTKVDTMFSQPVFRANTHETLRRPSIAPAAQQ